jgi:hypothetical protein
MVVMEHIVRSLTDCSFRAEVTILNIVMISSMRNFLQKNDGGEGV